MALSDPVKVLLFGAGSIGTVYLYQLQQAGCHVTAVCRSNYRSVKENGFKLNSVRYGNVVYKADVVVRDVSECQQERFDYILVCTKSYPGSTPSLPDLLRPVVEGRPDTVVVLAQNGIMIEEEVADAFPENPLLSGVVYLPATQTEPGVVEYPEMLNLLELGTYPAIAPVHHQDAAHKFAQLMIQGGGAAEVHENIQIARWSKLLLNCVWNPICALTLCTDGDYLLTSEPYAHELAWETMMEIVQLAGRMKVEGVTEDVAKKKFSIAKERAEKGTGREMSMLHDIRLSRPMEVEAIVGNVIRIGREKGLKMPRLSTLYALVKARNHALIQAKNAEGKRQ